MSYTTVTITDIDGNDFTGDYLGDTIGDNNADLEWRDCHILAIGENILHFPQDKIESFDVYGTANELEAGDRAAVTGAICTICVTVAAIEPVRSPVLGYDILRVHYADGRNSLHKKTEPAVILSTTAERVAAIDAAREAR